MLDQIWISLKERDEIQPPPVIAGSDNEEQNCFVGVHNKPDKILMILDLKRFKDCGVGVANDGQ